MNTTHEQLIILEESWTFVKSNPIFLGKRTEMSHRNDKNEILLKDDNFQYVKIKQILSTNYVLLQSSYIRNCILNYKTGKTGMFYFSVLNLSVYHNWSLKNIFLVAAAYSEDIKIYDIYSILEPIVKEIKDLEKYGQEIENETYFAFFIWI